MKFSKILSLGALVTAANAAVVYRTVHYHVTVTVDIDQPVATVDAGAPPPAHTEHPEESPSVRIHKNVVYKTVYADRHGHIISAGADAPAATHKANEVHQNAAAPKPTTLVAKPSVNANNDNSDNGNDSDLSDFAKTCVDVHNADRAQHSAQPLAWNDTLASYAQNYLNNQNCVFAHSGGPYGENIAMGYATTSDAIAAWYNEGAEYNYAAGQFSDETGHFTQVVWKGSSQLGCASVSCGSSGAFFACEYYPRGNIIGSFQKNVVAN
ncbi:protein Pry1p [Trichomonascus vanleenenianus]|uniref:protein Pry1p n=1 Tax=Trichomonascus vanleenenianus TaxID=2268995 RepID=UPI003EC9F281